jgi:hypothetical protein
MVTNNIIDLQMYNESKVKKMISYGENNMYFLADSYFNIYNCNAFRKSL